MKASKQAFGVEFAAVGVVHVLLIGAIVALAFLRPAGDLPAMDGPIELTVPDLPGEETASEHPIETDLAPPKSDPAESPAEEERPRARADEDDIPAPDAAPTSKPRIDVKEKPKSDTKPKPQTKPVVRSPPKSDGAARKTETGKPKIEVSKTVVRRGTRTGSKTTLTPGEIQRLLARGAKTGTPTLTDQQLRSLLRSDMRFGTGTQMSKEMLYLELVRQTLYKAWNQPTEIGIVGLVTRIELSLNSNGAVAGYRLTAGSGNRVMDDSVMRALRAVNSIPGLPADFLQARPRIPVAFELTGNR